MTSLDFGRRCEVGWQWERQRRDRGREETGEERRRGRGWKAKTGRKGWVGKRERIDITGRIEGWRQKKFEGRSADKKSKKQKVPRRDHGRVRALQQPPSRARPSAKKMRRRRKEENDAVFDAQTRQQNAHTPPPRVARPPLLPPAAERPPPFLRPARVGRDECDAEEESDCEGECPGRCTVAQLLPSSDGGPEKNGYLVAEDLGFGPIDRARSASADAQIRAGGAGILPIHDLGANGPCTTIVESRRDPSIEASADRFYGTGTGRVAPKKASPSASPPSRVSGRATSALIRGRRKRWRRATGAHARVPKCGLQVRRGRQANSVPSAATETPMPHAGNTSTSILGRVLARDSSDGGENKTQRSGWREEGRGGGGVEAGVHVGGREDITDKRVDAAKQVRAIGDEGTRERKGKMSIMLVLLTLGAMGKVEGSTKEGKEIARKAAQPASHIPGAAREERRERNDGNVEEQEVSGETASEDGKIMKRGYARGAEAVNDMKRKCSHPAYENPVPAPSSLQAAASQPVLVNATQRGDVIVGRADATAAL
ncbi:hypothetical protein DFH07DRAFT_769383 [Mycena maculata]|uniref:Uncharacterized protein n=1 Tax=Mycena maculata TaxID=230809 RepID=A0AAD7NP10_9AGAR|nr:hypothetical protein DFH07DRAFT_769383 [Mycena maculata]